MAVAQPGAHLTLATAAGVVQRARRHRVDVCTFRLPGEIDSTLLMSGCDPAVTILVDWLARRRSPVHAVAIPCSSRAALRAVVDGRAHVAGVHLRDQKSGEYNLAPIRRTLGNRPLDGRELCALGIGTCDGARQSAGNRWVRRPGAAGLKNREPRRRLRCALGARPGAAASSVSSRSASPGYHFEVGGHLEVAAAIATGQADAGVTIRLGADAYGLHFIPHRDERYDLVFMEHEAESMPIKAMLDALNSRRFAREISQLCGYDTAQMGQVVHLDPDLLFPLA